MSLQAQCPAICSAPARGPCRAPGSESPLAPCGGPCVLWSWSPGLAGWGGAGGRKALGTDKQGGARAASAATQTGSPFPPCSCGIVATCHSGYEVVGQRHKEKGPSALPAGLAGPGTDRWPQGSVGVVQGVEGGGRAVGGWGGEDREGRIADPKALAPPSLSLKLSPGSLLIAGCRSGHGQKPHACCFFPWQALSPAGLLQCRALRKCLSNIWGLNELDSRLALRG